MRTSASDWPQSRRWGKLGDARAVKPLRKALGDKDSAVRIAAAEMLGKLGDARAIKPLIRALGHKKVAVRRSAAESLVVLCTSTPGISLSRWEYVRHAVTTPHTDHDRIHHVFPGSHGDGNIQNCAIPSYHGDTYSSHGDSVVLELSHTDKGIGIRFPVPPVGPSRKTDF